MNQTISKDHSFQQVPSLSSKRPPTTIRIRTQANSKSPGLFQEVAKTEKILIKKKIIRDFFEIQINTPINGNEISITESKSTINNCDSATLYRKQNNNSAHIRKTRIQQFKDIQDQESRRDQICSRRHEAMLFDKELKIYGQEKYIQDVFTQQMKKQLQDKNIIILDQLQTPKLINNEEDKSKVQLQDLTESSKEIQQLETYQQKLVQNTALKENNPFLYVVVKKIARDKLQTLKASRAEFFDQGEDQYQLDYLQEGLNQIKLNGESSEKIKQNIKQRMKQLSIIQQQKNNQTIINDCQILKSEQNKIKEPHLDQQLQNRFKNNKGYKSKNASISNSQEKIFETQEKIRNSNQQKQQQLSNSQSLQKKKLSSIICSQSFGYIEKPSLQKNKTLEQQRQVRNFSLNLSKVNIKNQISNIVEQIETLRGESDTTKRKCLQNQKKINNMFQNLSRNHVKLQRYQDYVY